MPRHAPPAMATCTVCLKRRKCQTVRPDPHRLHKKITLDNFKYSERHRGWLCRPCFNSLEKAGGIREIDTVRFVSQTHVMGTGS